MNLSTVLYNEILPKVEKPSRYLGTELNTSHKNKDEVDLRVTLVFPDLYDLGLGNLGILILYSILNDLDWCWCERAYSPASDMESELRGRGLSLFNHESKDTLDEMDLIGITMQSELTYTNILTIIDLAGFPLRAEDRADDAPLFFAGGPTSFNPEPMAPFFDFFVIGDGEDVIVEIAECMRAIKDLSRLERLKQVAKIDGVYVPELYPFEVLADGQILPEIDAPPIRKRVIESLDGAKFPTNYIVPYTQQVHDRLSLEVLRGCTQGCRFCQAGMVTRPVRERTLENIDQLMKESLEKTGYEEVSLVSLSTCDFSRPLQLVDQAARRGREDRVSISLPSLRLDSFSVGMADKVADIRRSGLTFAPEAASPRLRAVINKWIPDEGLLEMSAEAFKKGWKHVKCYFMIGLPTERDEDIEAIVDLCFRNLKVGKAINPNAKINLGVSTFVPKPFTPFQWAEQIGMEETERRQRILDQGFKKTSSIKFGRHHAKTTFIEGLITRADRRCADLIETAWKNGARFESWDELCNLGAWQKAIEETNYDVEFALRERDPEERLPWDHIDMLVPKEWFQEDWARAMEYKHAPDCRAGKCHLCGVIFKEQELCSHMLKNQRKGRIEEKEWTPEPMPEYVEPEPIQRIRFQIGRTCEPRFLSRLEWMNAWIRTLRRARAPLSYSQGFHAHPKVNFAAALPVGEESRGDYMDITLKDFVHPSDLLERVRATLPDGFLALGAEDIPLRTPALMSSVSGIQYSLIADGQNAEELEGLISTVMASEEVMIERKVKNKKKGRGRGRQRAPKKTAPLNIRPMIHELTLSEYTDQQLTIQFTTHIHENKLAKPKEIIHLLGLDPFATRIVKCQTLLEDQNALVAR
ncbi:MAG: TIGR03960 family B12-binding radical SAM protein [Candidatus Hydrogenedentota bacterium]